MSDITAADPWPLLDELRNRGPIIWHEAYKRWMITTDREIRSILINFQRFTVEGTVVERLFGADAFIAIDDRQRHNELRAVWTVAFRKPALDLLRPAIKAIFDELMAPVAERLCCGETVDLADAVCRPLPTMVIALMMGIPDALLPDIVRWSDAMAAGGAAYLSEEEARAAVQTREDAKASLATCLREQFAMRRCHVGDDLISVIAHSDVAQRLAEDQLIQNVRQLLFAGNETTAKWLGHIFLTYAQHRDVQRELVADRSLVTVANDEVMRWQTVVGSLARRVRGGPIEVAGIELGDGDDITCLLASANRDPARYENPDVFDIHRRVQPNLGFGIGFHSCLGLPLAKLEAEMAVNGVLDSIPAFTIAGPCRYSSLPLRGPLPVMLTLDNS